MEAMLIAGTLLQAYGQISAAESAAAQMKSQAQMVEAQTESSIALEKASAAEATLDRLRQLREITGELMTKGASAGIGFASGSIGTLIGDSQSQFAREQGIQDFNVRQSVSSKKASASYEVSALKAQASNTKFQGYMKAAGTLMNYGAGAYDRGVFASSSTLPSGTPKPVARPQGV